MTSDDFVSEYMQNCIKNGLTSAKDIKTCLESDLLKTESDIKKKDEEKQKLIRKYDRLKHAFKQIGGEILTKKTVKTTTVSTKWDDLSTDMQNCTREIFAKFDDLDEIEVSVVASNVFDQEKRKNLILTMKWILDQRYLERSGSTLKKGSEWDNRPNG